MCGGISAGERERALRKYARKDSVINSFPVRIVTAIAVISLVNGVAEADRTSTKVYEPISGTSPCFIRLNGTDEIGCRSSSRGEVGVLHLVEDDQSLEWILKDGPHTPYIALLYPEYFNQKNLQKFQDSERVNGVLLLKEKKHTELKDGSFTTAKELSPFSTDSSCPNNQFGFYNTSSPDYCQRWNEPGNSILFESFKFPIFFVKNDTEADTLISCYRDHNQPVNGTPKGWPLCAGQLKSFMMAAKDTPTCLRRSSVFSISPQSSKVCDPLGDQNLVITLLPKNLTASENKSALILASRFDGASLFDEISPSADTSVTSLVTLLTVIKQLSKVKDTIGISSDSEINAVYFMLFNGEAFGYIGSGRMAYDMSHNDFPLKLDEIRYFLEVNQAAPRSEENKYFIHQSNPTQSKSLADLLHNEAKNVALEPTTSQLGVPPSSLHSFLRQRPDIPGLVITNHKDSYKNPFYNSIFDTKESIRYVYEDRDTTSIQQRIASLATTISNSVIKLLNSTANSTFSDNSETMDIVDELLYCYLESANCSMFRTIDSSVSSMTTPFPMYVGVSHYTNTVTQITRYLMVSWLGEVVDNATTQDTCFGQSSDDTDPDAAKRPRFFINSTCFDCPQVNLTEASSPAFIIPNYDWSSGKYPTWTESVWQKYSVRIFLKPSLLQEILTLISGILVVLISFAMVRFVNIKSDLIFPSRTDAMVC